MGQSDIVWDKDSVWRVGLSYIVWDKDSVCSSGQSNSVWRVGQGQCVECGTVVVFGGWDILGVLDKDRLVVCEV